MQSRRFSCGLVVYLMCPAYSLVLTIFNFTGFQLGRSLQKWHINCQEKAVSYNTFTKDYKLCTCISSTAQSLNILKAINCTQGNKLSKLKSLHSCENQHSYVNLVKVVLHLASSTQPLKIRQSTKGKCDRGEKIDLNILFIIFHKVFAIC